MSFNIETFMPDLKKLLPTAKNPTITDKDKEKALLAIRRVDKGRSKSPALGNGALSTNRK